MNRVANVPLFLPQTSNDESGRNILTDSGVSSLVTGVMLGYAFLLKMWLVIIVIVANEIQNLI